jgi:hypothetical protein
MAIQEAIEWSVNLKCNLATQATPPKCCHTCLRSQYFSRMTLSLFATEWRMAGSRHVPLVIRVAMI